jgi:hypothetical protein
MHEVNLFSAYILYEWIFKVDASPGAISIPERLISEAHRPLTWRMGRLAQLFERGN